MSNSLATQIISREEGFTSTPFWDYHQWTWGYGTNASPGNTNPNRNPGGSISEAQARAELQGRLSSYAAPVDALDGRYNWTPEERASLISFSYNLGPGKINQLTANGTRSKAEIADAMLLYNKAGGSVLDGLTNRRRRERAIFLGDDSVPENIESDNVGIQDGAEGQNSTSASDESSDYASAANLSDVWRMATDRGDFWDNELDDFELYTYNLEFFVVDEETAIKFLGNEYNLEDIVSDAWPGPTHKRVTVAMTGATAEFNLQDLNVESLGYGSGNNAKMSGHAVSLSFNIVQVGNTSLGDTLQNAAVLAGYASTLDAIWWMKIKFIGYMGNEAKIAPATKVLPFKLTDFRELQTTTDSRGTSSMLNGTIIQQKSFSGDVNLIDEAFSFEIKHDFTLKDTLDSFLEALNFSITNKNFAGDDKFVNTYTYEVSDEFNRFLSSKMNGIEANLSATNNQVERRIGGINIAMQAGQATPGLNIYNVVTDICNQSIDVKEELTRGTDTFTDMISITTTIIPKPGGSLNVLLNTRGHDVKYHIGIRRTPIVQNQNDLHIKVQNSSKMVNEILEKGRLRKCYYHQYTGLNDQILDLQVSLNKELQKTYVSPSDSFVYANFVSLAGGEPFELNDIAQRQFDILGTDSNRLAGEVDAQQRRLDSTRNELSELTDRLKEEFMDEVQSAGLLTEDVTELFSEDMNLEQLQAAMTEVDEDIASSILTAQRRQRLVEFQNLLASVEEQIAGSSQLLSGNEAEIQDLMMQAIGAQLSDQRSDALQSMSDNFELLGLDKSNSGFVLIEELDSDFVTNLSTAEFAGLVETMMENPTVFKRAVIGKLRDINRTTVLRSTNQEEIEVARQKYYEGLNVDISMQNITMTIKGDPFWLNNYITPDKAKSLFGDRATDDQYKNYTIDFSGQNYAMVITNKAAGTDEFDNVKIANLFISIYVVKNVTSSFSNGLFTQVLRMNKMPFPKDFTALNPTLDAQLELEEDSSSGEEAVFPSANGIPGQPQNNGENVGINDISTGGEGTANNNNVAVGTNTTTSNESSEGTQIPGISGEISNETNNILENPLFALEPLDVEFANGIGDGSIELNADEISVSSFNDSVPNISIPPGALTQTEVENLSPAFEDFSSSSTSPEVQTAIADSISSLVEEVTVGENSVPRVAVNQANKRFDFERKVQELEEIEQRMDEDFAFDAEAKQRDADQRADLARKVAIDALTQPNVEILDITLPDAPEDGKTYEIRSKEDSPYKPFVFTPLPQPDENSFLFDSESIKTTYAADPVDISIYSHRVEDVDTTKVTAEKVAQFMSATSIYDTILSTGDNSTFNITIAPDSIEPEATVRTIVDWSGLEPIEYTDADGERQVIENPVEYFGMYSNMIPGETYKWDDLQELNYPMTATDYGEIRLKVSELFPDITVGNFNNPDEKNTNGVMTLEVGGYGFIMTGDEEEEE